MAHRSTVADAFIAACTPPADEQGPVSVSGPLPTEPGTGVPRPLVDSADNPQPFQPAAPESHFLYISVISMQRRYYSLLF